MGYCYVRATVHSSRSRTHLPSGFPRMRSSNGGCSLQEPWVEEGLGLESNSDQEKV